MSDFPPTADFFAPHVAASAYRGDSWVSSNVDRPAADAPMNACGPVPPPANLASQALPASDVEPWCSHDLPLTRIAPCNVCGELLQTVTTSWRHELAEMDDELEEMTHAELVDLIESTPDPDELADEILARFGPPF